MEFYRQIKAISKIFINQLIKSNDKDNKSMSGYYEWAKYSLSGRIDPCLVIGM